MTCLVLEGQGYHIGFKCNCHDFISKDTEKHADWKHTRLILSAALSVSSNILQEKAFLSYLFIQTCQRICLKWGKPQGSLNSAWVALIIPAIVNRMLLKSAFGIGNASSHLVATELFPLQFHVLIFMLIISFSINHHSGDVTIWSPPNKFRSLKVAWALEKD
jgi:hypothetical protein